eukprot:6210931-Pleurochrysis_carterae.AAC.1
MRMIMAHPRAATAKKGNAAPDVKYKQHCLPHALYTLDITQTNTDVPPLKAAKSSAQPPNSSRPFDLGQHQPTPSTIPSPDRSSISLAFDIASTKTELGRSSSSGGGGGGGGDGGGGGGGSSSSTYATSSGHSRQRSSWASSHRMGDRRDTYKASAAGHQLRTCDTHAHTKLPPRARVNKAGLRNLDASLASSALSYPHAQKDGDKLVSTYSSQ